MDKNKSTKKEGRFKEVKRKMRRLTLAEKKQVKEEKQQQQQKDKKEKNKSKISQRVKININIPSSKQGYPYAGFPQQFDNKENVNILKSISEQLKKQSEIKPVTEMFNIPVKSSASIEPQRQPFETQNKTFEDIDYPKIKSSKTIDAPKLNLTELMDQIQKKARQRTDDAIKNMEETIQQNKPVEKIRSKLKGELLSGVAEKNEREMMERNDVRGGLKKPPIPPTASGIAIPIIDKPKDTSNLGLLEKVKKEINPEEFEKELETITKEFETLYRPNKEDYVKIDEAQQKIEDELQGFSEKVTQTNPLIPPKDTTSESIQEQVEKKKRGAPKLTEEEKKQREKQREYENELLERKKMNDKEIKEQQKAEQARELKERLAREREMEKQQKAEQIAREKEAEKQNKKQKELSNAFNVLLDNSRPELRDKLSESFQYGYLSKDDIIKKLKELRDETTKKKIFTDKEIKAFFKK